MDGFSYVELLHDVHGIDYSKYVSALGAKTVEEVLGEAYFVLLGQRLLSGGKTEGER